jgi:hypothetical protein
VNVVKLLRPEIGSVDLLTPVLSGYSTPNLTSASRGSGKGKASSSSSSSSLRPGYGTVSSTSVEDGISLSAVPQRRLKPAAASAQGRTKLSKLRFSTSYNNNNKIDPQRGETSHKEASILHISESQPSLALPMLLGASPQQQQQQQLDRSRQGRISSRADRADVPLLLVESQDKTESNETHLPAQANGNGELDDEEAPDVPVNTTDMLRDVLQNSFLAPSEPGSRSRQGSVRFSFGRKESFARKESFGGRGLSSLKNDRPRLASVLDGLEEEQQRESSATTDR